VKAWLPILLEKLPEAPVLAMATVRNLARAAVYDRQGQVLAGGLGSPVLAAQAADEAGLMEPGECRLLAQSGQLTLECLTAEEKTVRFWSTALENQSGAWASWLLTMPKFESGGLKLARHLLSAFGPWTTPRLPEEFKEQWSLLPLKAGLGRLFVLGDDALAMEISALAARVGLTVTWLSCVDHEGPDLEEARQMGEFELISLGAWSDLNLDYMGELGLKDGVKVMITTGAKDSFLELIKEARPAYVGLSGEAEGEKPEGLFPKPLTTSQKALGLIAEMLR